jgi:hypothetical protein
MGRAERVCSKAAVGVAGVIDGDRLWKREVVANLATGASCLTIPNLPAVAAQRLPAADTAHSV